MKNKVVVLMGGVSGERKISFLTGKACYKALRRKGYNVIKIDLKNFIIEKLKKIKPKVVFNALHGRFGEDGLIQCMLENLKLPYTHSGVNASNLAMDKEMSKKIFLKKKIKTPKYFVFKNEESIKYNQELIIKKIGFPLVIKPVNEGSSLGVYICDNKKQLVKHMKKLTIKYDRVLIEKYIPGREIQVAVMGKKALGAIELAPKRKFYDFKAKYSKDAKTKHIMPAPLSLKKYKESLKLAQRAHKAIGCRGITRSDFRFYKNKFYLLEINTQPGMTNLSLVPEIAKFKGIEFDDLVEWMVKDASCKR
jgi:D-alanine-D-alanine ligase